MGAWMDRWMDRWMGGWTDGCMDECMDRWMGRWVDGWVDGGFRCLDSRLHGMKPPINCSSRQAVFVLHFHSLFLLPSPSPGPRCRGHCSNLALGHFALLLLLP